MAKSYQEDYNRANSLTFSERNNLMDHALEIATKEGGYTKSEASRMMASNNAADKETARGWFTEAKNRESVRMKPTMPQMKQPDWEGYNQKRAESDLKSEYKQHEQETRTNINRIDNDRMGRKEKLRSNRNMIKNTVNDGLQNTESNISQEKTEIKNQAHKIRQKEEKRAGKGAMRAAWDKIWGNDEK
jgi:hypothetical protein